MKSAPAYRLTFDARGIPTAAGPDEYGAVYALGIAMGAQRGSQMDLLRRTAAGRLSEVLGPQAVPTDVVNLKFMTARSVEPSVQLLSGALARRLEAFAAGVNVSFERRAWKAIAGWELEPWSPAASLLVASTVFRQLTLRDEHWRVKSVLDAALPSWLVRLIYDGPDPYATDLTGSAAPPGPMSLGIWDSPSGLTDDAPEPPPHPMGSNCWVISGMHTVDGRPLLANDLHLPLTAPNLLYCARLEHRIRVCGVLVTGLPMFLSGRTEHIVWGITNACGRAARSQRINQEAVDTHEQKIDVSDGSSSAVLVSTYRGEPVPSLGYALRWTGHEPGALSPGLVGLETARTAAEAVRVCHAAAGPPLNVLFADVNGSIGWAMAGRVWHPTEERIARADELPSLLDPPNGILVSANNRLPQSSDLTVGHPSAYRAHTIAARLRAGGPHTIGSMHIVRPGFSFLP